MHPSQAKLLIVDDCRAMREVTRELMLDLGFGTVDLAADGQAALALLRGGSYDLVISDWTMPVLSGIDLLRVMRGVTMRCVTPVFLLTGDVTEKRRLEAVDAGVTELLEKPFPTAKLCEKVLGVIAARKPASEEMAA